MQPPSPASANNSDAKCWVRTIAHHRPSTISVVHCVSSYNTHHMSSRCIPPAYSSCVVRCMPTASNIHRYIRRTPQYSRNTSQMPRDCRTICPMVWRYESGSIGCRTLTRSLIATLALSHRCVACHNRPLFVCIATTIQAVLVVVYYIGMYICLYPQVEWLLPDRRLEVPETLDLVKASAHLITFTARYPGLVLEFSDPARDIFDSYTVMFNTRCSEYRRRSDADSAAEEGIARVLHLHVSTDHLSRSHALRCPLLSLCMCCCILSSSIQSLHFSSSPQSHVTQ